MHLTGPLNTACFHAWATWPNSLSHALWFISTHCGVVVTSGLHLAWHAHTYLNTYPSHTPLLIHTHSSVSDMLSACTLMPDLALHLWASLFTFFKCLVVTLCFSVCCYCTVPFFIFFYFFYAYQGEPPSPWYAGEELRIMNDSARLGTQSCRVIKVLLHMGIELISCCPVTISTFINSGLKSCPHHLTASHSNHQ